MTYRPVSYKRHRFPPQTIAHAVWLYFRFPLSLRLVEEMLLERGVVVSYETVRRWALKVGAEYARGLKRKVRSKPDIWHLDEVVISINGGKRYLWRAVDQDGYVLDEIVQIHRNTEAARRLLTRLLAEQGCHPKRIITDKLVPMPRPKERSCRMSNTASTSTKAGTGDARFSIMDGIAAFRFNPLRPAQPFCCAPFTTVTVYLHRLNAMTE
jgi:transposase-like protein